MKCKMTGKYFRTEENDKAICERLQKLYDYNGFTFDEGEVIKDTIEYLGGEFKE